ncbi:PilN family type IVB pilus formation outer membrane protein [Achromobacter sp. SD115]|jgi:type IVB pilus formation R64 PilN family outer membrane protein|uniref:PilN family type IVB pilus formation outer membrane protein n=1 Tax=Achromobacter TaxID=222 RepID=UPI000316DC3D|nr:MULTISPECIES: PilN family type IVB pilus formation outer membrane protein [Achromobacter]AZS81989.1 PilN family type IVB pilus formation outer membrane protein [Achromobacter spanius]MBO1017469.1 PilN family type IVB pilus formation outer membrane protein [Achromobacter sp. SD115]MDH0519440.1 PilN family type IVB pilus formation outer membrane protein [Achromobacter xylosoxidans]MDH0543738.1 PilN family type IVB pilus formation outer membrane protein [Achromobacter xylosoxidans]QKQ54347.1 P
MMRKAIVIAIAFATTLSGCALQRIKDTEARVDDAYGEHAASAASMRKTRDRAVEVIDRPWVSKTPITRPSAAAYPAPLQCPITFVPAAPISVFEFGQTVTALCGVPVRITPDAITALSGGARTAARTPDMTPPTGSGGPIPPGGVGALSAGSSLPSMSARDTTISGIRWDGKPLPGLLDAVTSRLGLSWTFRDGAVQIHYLDTRVFRIYAIQSKTNMQSVVQSGTQLASSGTSGQGAAGATSSSGSGGSTVSGGSTQTTMVSIESNLAEDVDRMIKSMLTPGLGQSSLSVSTGTVAVTDTPDVLSRIAAYLKTENRNITRQALFNITVAVVQRTETDDQGLDLTAVYKSLNGNYGITVANAFTAASSAGSASIGILDTATGTAGQFAGSKAILRALSSQGRVSIVTQPSVTTLNYQPVPVQVAKQTSYLAAVSNTATAQVGSTSALTPGTVTTGFSMDLLPFMIDSDQMLLQFTMNLSTDPRLRTVTSGDNSIEVPEVDSRIFSQRVRLRSGQTLILSGFEQNVDRGNRSGMFSPSNWLTGGGGSTNNRREVVVILITPIVLDDDSEIHESGGSAGDYRATAS